MMQNWLMNQHNVNIYWYMAAVGWIKQWYMHTTVAHREKQLTV